MNLISGFADWVIALLPRLLLYPGGAALIAGGLLAWLLNPEFRQFRLRGLLTSLAQVNVPATALAWTAAALLSAPSVAPLPFAAGTFVLTALLAVSLFLDMTESWEAWACAAITLALAAPLANGRGLLDTGWDISSTPASVIGILAVAVGLLSLLLARPLNLSGTVRYLAWATLALPTGWGWLAAPALLIVGAALGRPAGRTNKSGSTQTARAAAGIAGLLAGISLVATLLLHRG